jgi:putative toxin-antitoxin system antitoxin component (TIGR02293 family)
MVARRKTNVPARPPHDAGGGLLRFLHTLLDRAHAVPDVPGVSFFVHVAPLTESSAIERGLPATTWRQLQRVGFTRDEIATVVGNSAKTIRRKENRSERLDVSEGDRTMRLLRVTVEAIESIGDADRAVQWMRRSNIALGGQTPLAALATEAGTALVRRALGVIAYGGIA